MFVKVISLRKGIYTIDPHKFSGLNPVLTYVGLHISNTILSFVYVLFVVGFTMFPLFWPLFWIIIWDHFSKILFIILSAIIVPIIKLIAKMFVVSKDSVTRRR